MNKERRQKVIIYSGLFFLAASTIAAGFLLGNYTLFYILAVVLFFIIFINIELYLRVQHNIDTTRLGAQYKQPSQPENINIQQLREAINRQNYLDEEINKLKIQKEWFNKKVIPLLLNEAEKDNPDNVSVIIPWKNIGYECAFNCLKSISSQNYDKGKIDIILVDYDSDDCQAISKMKSACEEFKASYLRVDNTEEWSRSCALNIAIKKSNSKYILISDIDIIFEKNYISECVREMKRYPYQALYTNMWRLPEGFKPDQANDYYKLKEESFLKQNVYINPEVNPELVDGASIIFTMRQFFYFINGYDEHYSLWGYEDCDIIKRFKRIGIKITNINHRTSHIHQWHSQFAGVEKIEGFREKVKENGRYYEQNIFDVNLNGWGIAKDFKI